MKHLSYDEVAHQSTYDYGARYAIDWESGERKYKIPYSGIRVYENGLIEVSRMGYNDPSWRYDVRVRFDLDFRLRSGFKCQEFFDPDTGRKVRKSHVRGNVFLYDDKLQRVYAGKSYGASMFTFMSEHAQPIASNDLTYAVPNKMRFNERMDALKEHFALGETLAALSVASPSFSYSLFRTPFSDNAVPPDLTSEDGRNFCLLLHHNKEHVKKDLINATKDVFTVKYLNVKEK